MTDKDTATYIRLLYGEPRGIEYIRRIPDPILLTVYRNFFWPQNLTDAEILTRFFSSDVKYIESYPKTLNRLLRAIESELIRYHEND